ncbi:hypothetical protein VitviT2T_007118 [Vitis vinifera]|uniref:Uncharacterized protein n=1 Tax=Vitis vinifera TaxID=29760 RepID=A0ABY9BXY4_VITVI|nr:hypothetical protein VitviT2T_007118 [Vitis vinifera]
MPCSSKNSSSSSRDDNGALRAFKLSESTFLASLMPRKGIVADRFLEAHSKFWCVTSYLSLGSGDIDTSTVVKADSDGCLGGASGSSLVVNSSWKNTSGEWHVGYKVIYKLCTDTLTSRLKVEVSLECFGLLFSSSPLDYFIASIVSDHVYMF